MLSSLTASAICSVEQQTICRRSEIPRRSCNVTALYIEYMIKRVIEIALTHAGIERSRIRLQEVTIFYR